MRDVKEFGQDLLRRLGALDISASELAARSGVHQTSISAYVNGMNVPYTNTLRRLDAALPGLFDAWSYAVAEYHRAVKIRSLQSREDNRAAHHNKPRKEYVSKPQPAPQKKVPPSIVGPSGSLTQICRAARKAGMTYGQYVATHSTRGGV